jgi:predicted RNase H-like HicB family nuclease
MLRIESERESDGRWLAEVPSLPGVLSYGSTDTEARSKATALALRVIAERVERGEALRSDYPGAH